MEDRERDQPGTRAKLQGEKYIFYACGYLSGIVVLYDRWLLSVSCADKSDPESGRGCEENLGRRSGSEGTYLRKL